MLSQAYSSGSKCSGSSAERNLVKSDGAPEERQRSTGSALILRWDNSPNFCYAATAAVSQRAPKVKVRPTQFQACLTPHLLACRQHPVIRCGLSERPQRFHVRVYCKLPVVALTGLPIASPDTTSSTLRFSCRPAGLSFEATGRVLPKPFEVTEFVATP